jgi:hypothetical protein
MSRKNAKIGYTTSITGGLFKMKDAVSKTAMCCGELLN